jgi:hypothetical protein
VTKNGYMVLQIEAYGFENDVFVIAQPRNKYQDFV